MSMNSMKMKRILEERLANSQYRISFNRDNDVFRIEWKESKQGVNVKLPQIIAKYNERGQVAIDELVAHLNESLSLMNKQYTLTGMEKSIFPVIRSTSFPTETNAGKSLVTKDHTAETRIFFAIDLGKSYKLIEKEVLEKEAWNEEQLLETALFNVRSLDTSFKKDSVAENDFYFIATQDGYDASRILNDSFLEKMASNCEGDVAIAVPHQDVLIIADIRNDTGYDILAQMTMKFFAEGRIPITSLSFIYENKHLEPIFIMARKKPRGKK